MNLWFYCGELERLWVGVYVATIVHTNMRDKHYKGKHIRMSEETWKKLKVQRKRSGLSWNLFMLKLVEKK